MGGIETEQSDYWNYGICGGNSSGSNERCFVGTWGSVSTKEKRIYEVVRMKITKTVTRRKEYEVTFYPEAPFNMTVGEFIRKREELGAPTNGFKTCFICDRRLSMNKEPVFINVSGVGNRFSCTRCYRQLLEEQS